MVLLRRKMIRVFVSFIKDFIEKIEYASLPFVQPIFRYSFCRLRINTLRTVGLKMEKEET
jgi:hypothetical protein